MLSFLERLLGTVFVLATPLFAAAVAKKSKPKRAAPRSSVKRGRPAQKPGRRPATKKVALKKRAGKPPKKSAGRAPARPAPPAKATPTPPARPSPAPKPVPPTGRAILLAPEHGKFADSLHPKFRWLSVGGAARYEVAWSDRPDFANSQTIVSIATEAAVPAEEPLTVGDTYYWRVRGGNESGWGPWSPPASFQVLEELPTF